MKKIRANYYIQGEYYVLQTPTIKNYDGRLTLTKIYLKANKDDHNKKIKKNDPLFEFAIYEPGKEKGFKSILSFWAGDIFISKAEKILITSPVSAIFKYRGEDMAHQDFAVGSDSSQTRTYIPQGETLVLLQITSKDKKKNKILKQTNELKENNDSEKNIDKKNKSLQDKIRKLKE